MGDRLRFEIDVDERLQSWEIPQMALQILVENAVLHGISKKKDGGTIRVSAGTPNPGDPIVLTVRDDGAGLADNRTGNGMALINLRQRLHLLYRDQAELYLREHTHSSGGVEAILTIPRAKNR